MNKFVGGFVFLGLVIGAMAYFGRLVNQAGNAERDLHALILAIDVVEVFVNEHGRWPNSWDELASTSPSTNRSMYQWPRHRAEIEKRIDIDFGLDLEEIDFTVDSLKYPIRCRDVYYIEQEHRFQFLIEAVEKHRKGSESAAS